MSSLGVPLCSSWRQSSFLYSSWTASTCSAVLGNPSTRMPTPSLLSGLRTALSRASTTTSSGTSLPSSLSHLDSGWSSRSCDTVTARLRPLISRIKSVLAPFPEPGAPLSHTISLGGRIPCWSPTQLRDRNSNSEHEIIGHPGATLSKNDSTRFQLRSKTDAEAKLVWTTLESDSCCDALVVLDLQGTKPLRVSEEDGLPDMASSTNGEVLRSNLWRSTASKKLRVSTRPSLYPTVPYENVSANFRYF
mmetsp:Transcript_14211/g.33633  ORF Transcript_14211/g.33633 Transcript_14211/m.33633 type:complete len:248 (+) Transcript_14211:421-1164(+)